MALTYKQSQTIYALRRNRESVVTTHKHKLIARAASEGIDTRTIAESIGLSMRQVQRIVVALIK